MIIKIKKEYTEFLNKKIKDINIRPKSEKNNIKINNNNIIENKLMENLNIEMNKKNNIINQLKNRINDLDISLDSSLIKNKELNNHINILKSNIEKLKMNINSINISNNIKYKDLIISNNISFLLHSNKILHKNENKDILKDYILVSKKVYQNLKWFLLKNKNSENSNKYCDYIWIDGKHLNEKDIEIKKEIKLFKFNYHNHNIKNNKYKDEINNSKHSLIISNIRNNQYFIFQNYNIVDLNKSYSFTKKLDNSKLYKKLINFNKSKKNSLKYYQDLKKLDNLAISISNIDQENNDEENSLINEIKNISNKNDNIIIDKNNLLEENKILNEEAFMKTYNSEENELEATKNQLVFIKNELRDLKNKLDVVKFSFINLFGKINFPKKYKIEIIQLLKLVGVDDNKLEFIFSSK